MSFTWSPIPSPTPVVPPPIPPTEVSYKVDVVANTVDYGGVVRYNTSTRSYDIIYEFPTLNVANGHFTNGIFDSADITTLNANVTTANTVTINTANITSAQFMYATISGTPTTNLSIVNKAYVDNAIASISGGSGPDTTANLILAKGDLLVGISPNTAVRLPAGSNGQVLQGNSASTVKMAWVDTSISQESYGLYIGTHYHPSLKDTNILLRHADAIVMDSGDYVTGWDNLSANIFSSGVGGLDSISALAANTWYEVYAIYNPTTSDKGLLLHRSIDRTVDQFWDGQSGPNYLRRSDIALTAPFQRYCDKVSQSFIPTVTAPLKAIDLRMAGVGTPFPGNVWITIEPDDGSLNASGTILATSRAFSTLAMGPSTVTGHFIFDTTTTLTAGGRYHLVCRGDWPINLQSTLVPNSVAIYGNTAPTGPDPNVHTWTPGIGYNGDNSHGVLFGYGDSRMYNVVTQRWSQAANLAAAGAGVADLYFKLYMEQHTEAVSLPSGYTQKALVSYACTNQNSRLKTYSQVNRTMCMGFDPNWRAWSFLNTDTQGISFYDLSSVIPPVSCAVDYLVWSNTQSIGVTFSPMYSALDISFTTVDSLRGSVYLGGRTSQIYPTPTVNMDDGQGILAYTSISFSDIFIGSITF